MCYKGGAQPRCPTSDFRLGGRLGWAAQHERYRAAAAFRYAPASVPTPYVVDSCSTQPAETATPPTGMLSAKEKVVGAEVVWGACAFVLTQGRIWWQGRE